MAVLAAPFDVGIKVGDEIRVKMAAVKIWQGSAVGVVIGTGYATPLLIATAGMKFIGVALETVDNSAGSAGDKWIRLQVRGLVGFNSDSLDVSNVGQTVYFKSGSDDNTVCDTVSVLPAGQLMTIDSNSVAWVDITYATASPFYNNTSDNKIYIQGYGVAS